MSRLSWTDPAPLDVERPRLPWWLMLPKWLLALAAPVLLVVIAALVVVFMTRRAYRYPATCAVACAALGLYLLAGWPAVLTLVAVLGAALGACAWPAS
ncbi:MAG: hypothetical protein GEU83_09150 [Pseudonocardiaceae bacterium]|nr:hypothetical protein [Pseudonocardiaceae bacterium]